MHALTRRDFLYLSLAASAGLARGETPKRAGVDVHQQILELAAKQQERRRARFAAVRSQEDLAALQKMLRQSFLDLLDGLPKATGPPPVKKLGRIKDKDYSIEKLVYESFPGYFVSALLYQPKNGHKVWPAILSPCGHSVVGKADAEYQILHTNLAKRGYVVLTYDPVGQAERSQFWDRALGRSRFNLACGEHAVLGNPLYLLGTSLARYRIWDGMRGLDYLTSLAEVDAQRIGCIGNSGGGTLTAYIAALDPRVSVAVICCYITTLPRRMGNRIQEDPDADPEQDIFGFVSAGIDHAGLLALRAPRPTLLATARYDFFPIEGARESYAEAKKLYEVLDAGDRIQRAEAAEKHGLTLPLRRAAYGWFDRWLYERQDQTSGEEIAVRPRPAKELHVCNTGQVNLSFPSRPLLPLALEEFQNRKKRRHVPLKELLRLDPNLADFHLTELAAGSKTNPTLIVCVNGIDAPDWREETEFVRALSRQECAVTVVDSRGVGTLRPPLRVKGHRYGDPLEGVEENIAYNAFLVGKSLLGMRVTDVLAAVAKLREQAKAARLVLCARRDAAFVACLAAALEPAIQQVAVEEMLLSFLPLFEASGEAINAANLLPGLLRDFGEVADVLAAIAPRRLLVAAPHGKGAQRMTSVQMTDKRFTSEPELLINWLRE